MEVTSMPNRLVPMYRRQIGIVFQDFRLLQKKTVYENVAFAMEAVHQSRRLIKKQVPHILNLVGISEKADRYPHELSGGEQQRVAIARAIVNNPKLLIADEPTGNLDPEKSWEIMNLLNQINMRGTTVVMVTHEKDIVDRMGKRVIQIETGKIVRDDRSGSYIEEAKLEPSGNELLRAEAAKLDARIKEKRHQERLKRLGIKRYAAETHNDEEKENSEGGEMFD
jgi:cell division transport system ATP-binding protein